MEELKQFFHFDFCGIIREVNTLSIYELYFSTAHAGFLFIMMVLGIGNKPMKMRTSRRVSYLIGVLAGVLVFIVLQIAINNMINVSKRNETLDITNRYISFQNTVKEIIYTNITLLNGYLAYVETNPNLDQYYAEMYLEDLINRQETYIRNVATIQDTTIIWNYPLEGNEASIGVDLVTVETQRESILKTKETLEPNLQGPVQLVQGGMGFIVRLPIIKEETYWGLISIVIEGEAFYQAISKNAIENDMNIRLFQAVDYPDSAFYETDDLSKEKVLSFNLKADLVDWKLEISPKSGWYNYSNLVILGMILSIIVAVFIGYLLTRNLISLEKNKYQANHDFLTGLYNRTFLEPYQSLVLSRAERQDLYVGFMIIDVNKFKKINDDNGHHVGDYVLKYIAQELLQVVRSNEAVFRLGGDEFLVVFPEVKDKEEIQSVKTRIVDIFKESKTIAGKKIDISLGIGFSIYPIDADNIDELLKIADQTMYTNKQEGDD